MEENWDDDSTPQVISPEDFSSVMSKVKTYDNDRGNSDNNRYNRQGGRGGGRDDGWGNRDAGKGDGWGMSNDTNRGGGGKWGDDRQRSRPDRRDQGRNENVDSSYALNMDIDPSKVGMVIGRGGSKINEIQEKFVVNVKVCKFIIFINYCIFVSKKHICFAVRDGGYNGMASVSIRGGSSDDRTKTKVFIEELIGDKPSPIFKEAPSTNKPEEEFVQIDWQGLAKECVSSLVMK